MGMFANKKRNLIFCLLQRENRKFLEDIICYFLIRIKRIIIHMLVVK